MSVRTSPQNIFYCLVGVFSRIFFHPLTSCPVASDHSIPFDETLVQNEESLGLSFAFGFPRFCFGLSVGSGEHSAGTQLHFALG